MATDEEIMMARMRSFLPRRIAAPVNPVLDPTEAEATGQPSLDTSVQNAFGMNPDVERLNLLPRYSAKDGLVAPSIVYDAARAITAPGHQLRHGNLGPSEAMETALGTMGGGMGVSSAVGAPVGALGMNVYHGTPHRFRPTKNNPLGEFDASKIGTGEGAQAYGRGLYFAENPEVAARYAQPISADDAFRSGNWLLAIRNSIKPQRNFYKADLPDEQIAKMLDWDKPLSEQTHLMNKTGPHGPDFTFKNLLERFGVDPATTTGGQFIRDASLYQGTLRPGRGQEKAAAISKTLNEYGIPGIRYLDQGSRAAGEGTRNFVVFDPKHVNIIGRE